MRPLSTPTGPHGNTVAAVSAVGSGTHSISVSPLTSTSVRGGVPPPPQTPLGAANVGSGAVAPPGAPLHGVIEVLLSAFVKQRDLEQKQNVARVQAAVAVGGAATTSPAASASSATAPGGGDATLAAAAPVIMSPFVAPLSWWAHRAFRVESVHETELLQIRTLLFALNNSGVLRLNTADTTVAVAPVGGGTLGLGTSITATPTAAAESHAPPPVLVLCGTSILYQKVAAFLDAQEAAAFAILESRFAAAASAAAASGSGSATEMRSPTTGASCEGTALAAVGTGIPGNLLAGLIGDFMHAHGICVVPTGSAASGGAAQAARRLTDGAPVWRLGVDLQCLFPLEPPAQPLPRWRSSYDTVIVAFGAVPSAGLAYEFERIEGTTRPDNMSFSQALVRGRSASVIVGHIAWPAVKGAWQPALSKAAQKLRELNASVFLSTAPAAARDVIFDAVAPAPPASEVAATQLMSSVFALRCPRHPLDPPTLVSSSGDSAVLNAAAAGALPLCKRLCMRPLRCGVVTHRCLEPCHSPNEHAATRCGFTCKRVLPCGHICRMKCSEPCDCLQRVECPFPACGGAECMPLGDGTTTPYKRATHVFRGRCVEKPPATKCAAPVARRCWHCFRKVDLPCWEAAVIDAAAAAEAVTTAAPPTDDVLAADDAARAAASQKAPESDVPVLPKSHFCDECNKFRQQTRCRLVEEERRAQILERARRRTEAQAHAQQQAKGAAVGVFKTGHQVEIIAQDQVLDSSLHPQPDTVSWSRASPAELLHVVGTVVDSFVDELVTTEILYVVDVPTCGGKVLVAQAGLKLVRALVSDGRGTFIGGGAAAAAAATGQVLMIASRAGAETTASTAADVDGLDVSSAAGAAAGGLAAGTLALAARGILVGAPKSLLAVLARCIADPAASHGEPTPIVFHNTVGAVLSRTEHQSLMMAAKAAVAASETPDDVLDARAAAVPSAASGVELLRCEFAVHLVDPPGASDAPAADAGVDNATEKSTARLAAAYAFAASVTSELDELAATCTVAGTRRERDEDGDNNACDQRTPVTKVWVEEGARSVAAPDAAAGVPILHVRCVLAAAAGHVDPLFQGGTVGLAREMQRHVTHFAERRSFALQAAAAEGGEATGTANFSGHFTPVPLHDGERVQVRGACNAPLIYYPSRPQPSTSVSDLSDSDDAATDDGAPAADATAGERSASATADDALPAGLAPAQRVGPCYIVERPSSAAAPSGGCALVPLYFLDVDVEREAELTAMRDFYDALPERVAAALDEHNHKDFFARTEEAAKEHQRLVRLMKEYEAVVQRAPAAPTAAGAPPQVAASDHADGDQNSADTSGHTADDDGSTTAAHLRHLRRRFEAPPVRVTNSVVMRTDDAVKTLTDAWMATKRAELTKLPLAVKEDAAADARFAEQMRQIDTTMTQLVAAGRTAGGTSATFFYPHFTPREVEFLRREGAIDAQAMRDGAALLSK